MSNKRMRPNLALQPTRYGVAELYVRYLKSGSCEGDAK